MQNDPKPPAIAGEVVLSGGGNCRKVNGRQPGESQGLRVPTAFIDVHDDLAFLGGLRVGIGLTVTGLTTAFSPSKQTVFHAGHRQPTLQQQFSGGGKNRPSLQGSNTLQRTCGRNYMRDDGSTCRSAGC